MNKYIFLLLCILVSATFSHAQADYKVVFDLTSKDSIDHHSVIRWVREISKGSPNAKMEVIMYGKGISLAMRDKSFAGDDVIRLAANPQVKFKVCAAALKNQGVVPAQLLPGIEIIPDGIYEIIKRQKQGYGYIKVKN